MREKVLKTNPDKVHATLRMMIAHNCPGLLGHRSHTVLASLGDPEPARGRLPTWVYRVKLDGGQTFIFKLTRQSDAAEQQPFDLDGFERCWFVWSVKPDDDRGGDDDGAGITPSPDKLVLH